MQELKGKIRKLIIKIQSIYFVFILILISLSACDRRPNNLVLIDVQPKALAQRNHTNFYPALQCMDQLFLKSGRSSVLISANQIPDRTRSIYVDTRGMIITALNHMTRRSKAFVFVEQGLVGRTSGDTLALEKDSQKNKRPPVPVLYINGAISQVDKAVRSTSVKADISDTYVDDTGISSSNLSVSRSHSVVSLDLHLVNFPSRVVVPGSAISNSLAVTSKGFSHGLAGRISQRTLGVSINLNRIESTGQAVRSLIELGLIEMLGNLTGVPFWECLSHFEVNAFNAGQEERKHILLNKKFHRLWVAQEILKNIGYKNVKQTGYLDNITRGALANFQAKQGIIANGVLDFDTYRALSKIGSRQQKMSEKRDYIRFHPKMIRPTIDREFRNIRIFFDDEN